jgi:hypothetical protein
VISRLAACAVSSFSLESNWTMAPVDTSANPSFVDGALIHPCTAAVTSRVTNCPDEEICRLPTLAPKAGSVM